MRQCILGLLCAAGLLGSAQAGDTGAKPRTFGKKPAEILKMGSARWMEFFDSRGGSSTAAMSEAATAYRDALRWRNDGLAKQVGAGTRERVRRLRPLLRRFTDDRMDVGFFITGGGTIWSNIHAGANSDVEETLYRLLGGTGKKPAPMVVSMVTKKLDALTALVEARRKGTKDRPAEALDAARSMNKLRNTFTQIVAIASKFDRTGSNHILGFCHEQSKPTAGEE